MYNQIENYQKTVINMVNMVITIYWYGNLKNGNSTFPFIHHLSI